MLLSVLTPSHNYEKFLTDALMSVHEQGDDVEHVVVDGGSTDGTLKILRQWSDRIRFISEPDGGQSDALNKAAALAKGEWLGWLNADEFYFPGAVEAVRGVLRQNPDADVIYGDCCLVNVQGRMMRLMPQHPFHARTLRWYGPIMASCAVFVRKSALPARGWDTELRRMMDWDLYLELLRKNAKFHHFVRPLAAFRVHDSQVTAVQVPVWAGEASIIRSRHRLTAAVRKARVERTLGRVEHGMRKLVNGAYLRQRLVRQQLGGEDLRWFASNEGRANAERLVQLASRKPR